MHEIIFAKTVLRELEPLIDKSKEVIEVVVELGELVGILENDLKEALQKQSLYKYRIVMKPSLIRCPCGYEGRAEIIERLHDKVIFKCPVCDESEEVMEVVEGDKIKILRVVYN